MVKLEWLVEWLGQHSLTWSIIWLTGLLILFIAVWREWECVKVEVERYKNFRNTGALLVAAFAVLTVYRVASAVYYGEAKGDPFRPELIGYTMFWVLFPPVWFFLEYYAIDHAVVSFGNNTDRLAFLKKSKDYADLASKIWAAILLGLGSLLGLVAKESPDQVTLLNCQGSVLQKQLKELNSALAPAKSDIAQMDTKIKDLGKQVRLADYHSEFFGRLREVLGKREDVKMVGDRFVFSCKVLFPSGSDQIGAEGVLQLGRLAKRLKEVSAEIPQDLD